MSQLRKSLRTLAPLLTAHPLEKEFIPTWRPTGASKTYVASRATAKHPWVVQRALELDAPLGHPHLSSFLQDLFQQDEEVARVPADQFLEAPTVQTQPSCKRE